MKRVYSLSYFWPDQKFKTVFMTWPLHQNSISYLHIPVVGSSSDQRLKITVEHDLLRAFVDFLFNNNEKVAS